MATVPRKGIQGFGIGFNKPEIIQFEFSQNPIITTIFVYEMHKTVTDFRTLTCTSCSFSKMEDHLISDDVISTSIS
jgi:hypothetical protein